MYLMTLAEKILIMIVQIKYPPRKLDRRIDRYLNRRLIDI